RPLPDSLRAGTMLSHDDLETIDRLFVRRGAHIDRLVRREQLFADTLRRAIQLGSTMENGRTLTPEQVDTLRWLASRQDEHLKYLYDREKLFTDRLDDLEKIARARFPLRGAMKLAGDIEGYWGDQWAGTDLRVCARTTGPVSELRISGHVPHGITDGQDLVLTVAD